MKKIIGILIAINLMLVLVNLEFSGIIYHNDFFARRYKVHGIDISHHQVRVNWSLVDKRYKFVLMKATEGKDFLDTDFIYNWNKAQLNGFKVGAYHYFSMLSSGEAQARYYISKVPKINNSFPPIIDLEISSKYPKDIVLEELKKMIKILEKKYERKVIIYVDYRSYNAFLKNELIDNEIWIRDVKKKPMITENKRWTIWQYSNRGRVKGIDGFTDKNALRYDLEYYIK